MKAVERVGYFCTYVPPELIEAAGFVPKRLIPPSAEKDEVALDPNFCPYIKALYHHLPGEGIRAVVLINSCDGMRRLSDAVRRSLGMACYLLDVPKRVTPEAVAYFRETLVGFSAWLAELGGREVTEGEVLRAIRDYNGRRAAFFQMLGERPRMGDVLRILKDGFPPPVERLREVRKGQGGRIRVMVTGSMLEADGLLDLIEEGGAEVTILDVCSGPRGPERVGVDGDPFYMLAEAYLKKAPCSRMEARHRWTFLRKAIGEVDAVISYVPKFCDQYLYEASRLQELCRAHGKPFLQLEGEYTTALSESMRIRLQAFLERWAQGISSSRR